MRTKFGKFLYICLFSCICIATSCNSMGKKANKVIKREQMMSELEAYKANLPMEISGTGIYIDNVQIENDMVVYTCKLPAEMWQTMSLSKEASTSDCNMARVISNVDRRYAQNFIDAGLGLKFIYKSSETGGILMEVEMSAKKLEEILKKLQNNEIEPYTLMELTQMEISQMNIPSQMGDGIWLTDVYIKGNAIFYNVTIENVIDKDDISYADVENLKRECIMSLRGEKLMTIHKKEFIRENIHFIYVYKDSRGIEFARINIGPEDVF